LKDRIEQALNAGATYLDIVRSFAIATNSLFFNLRRTH
jgi:hypothetical protein